MKVIQITSFYKPNIGGVEKQVEYLASYLKSQNVEVEIYTTNALHDKNKRIRKFEKVSYDNDIKLIRFRVFLSFGHFFRFSPSLLLKLLVSDCDIIHIHNSHDAHLIGAILIKLIRRKKLIITGHNPYIVGSEKRGNVLHKLVASYDLVMKVLMRFADQYIALLQSEKVYVNKKFKIGNDKINVIPNGISEIFYTQSSDTQLPKVLEAVEFEAKKYDLVVGTASRINFVKGIQNLQDAVNSLNNALFIVVGGDDGYLNDIKNMYQKNNNILILNTYIDQRDLVKFYDLIDIFLLPSIYEPFGMTIVEAMARGKFVLSTNVGGTNEIIKPEFGELLAPTDQKAWTERIKYYSEHKDRLKNAAKPAKLEAEQYRQDIVAERILSVYEKVLEK